MQAQKQNKKNGEDEKCDLANDGTVRFLDLSISIWD